MRLGEKQEIAITLLKVTDVMVSTPQVNVRKGSLRLMFHIPTAVPHVAKVSDVSPHW